MKNLQLISNVNYLKKNDIIDVRSIADFFILDFLI